MYTQTEVMIDFNGYSREFFLGGESHAAISLMSERLWDKVGCDVIGFLDANPGYELIVGGHSLGGKSYKENGNQELCVSRERELTVYTPMCSPHLFA